MHSWHEQPTGHNTWCFVFLCWGTEAQAHLPAWAWGWGGCSPQQRGPGCRAPHGSGRLPKTTRCAWVARRRVTSGRRWRWCLGQGKYPQERLSSSWKVSWEAPQARHRLDTEEQGLRAWGPEVPSSCGWGLCWCFVVIVHCNNHT